MLIADRDHIFFEYSPTETSAVISEMFRGYAGFVQADAKSVYDILFREKRPSEPGDDVGCRTEVGCWAHCRRKVWEATVAKSVVAREGLARIGRIFALDASWRGRPPAEILGLRNAHLRPHLEAFFAWAEVEYDAVKEQRGLLRSALGYAVRQQGALMRVLDDGRLVLENNRSERALRNIAVGRKAWLFVGSDDHAHSAGHLFSLIASARLHGLDPEAYLRDLFRVLAHWPRDRYLELAAKYWASTRARLDPAELASRARPPHRAAAPPHAAYTAVRAALTAPPTLRCETSPTPSCDSAPLTNLARDGVRAADTQWGRCFAAAETRQGVALARHRRPLQWGRCFAAAETRSRC